MAHFGDGRPLAEDAFAPYLLWGTFALCAVVLAAASAAIALGGRGDAKNAAAKRIAIQAQAPMPAPSFAELELARLADVVRSLSADRERLAARLEQIERSMGDITASVTRERPAAVPANPAAVVTAPAQAPAAQPAAAPRAAVDSTVTRTEFAVDLGGDTSVEALRALWATMRGNHPALANLKPMVSVRDGAKPGIVELRLVVGPLANAAAAARICALLAASRVACQTAIFEGQRLALR